MKNCAIIIPCVNVDNDTKLSIRKCLQLEDINFKIYIVSDSKFIPKKKNKKIVFLNFGSIFMSEKRNKAVSFCDEEYVAFLDSDAYPSKKWLINAINLLNKDKKIGLVSGPDYPFPNQKGLQKLIGVAHKSFWLSGSKTFRKNNQEECYTKQVSSCNMVMKKKIFKDVGGMNNDLYIGEDAEFCNKVNKFYKISHSPNIKIFHKSRKFIPFLFQRFAYGTCFFDVFKNGFFFSNIQYLFHLFFFIFFISFPLIFFVNNYYLIYFSIIGILFMTFFLDAMRLTSNIIDNFKIIFIFLSSLISFGLGSFLRIFGLTKNLKKIYTYRN